MYDGWEWQTGIAPGGKVQRDMRTWASSKSFSQGFWPCHSTDRASGTLSAVAANGANNPILVFIGFSNGAADRVFRMPAPTARVHEKVRLSWPTRVAIKTDSALD